MTLFELRDHLLNGGKVRKRSWKVGNDAFIVLCSEDGLHFLLGGVWKSKQPEHSLTPNDIFSDDWEKFDDKKNPIELFPEAAYKIGWNKSEEALPSDDREVMISHGDSIYVGHRDKDEECWVIDSHDIDGDYRKYTGTYWSELPLPPEPSKK